MNKKTYYFLFLLSLSIIFVPISEAQVEEEEEEQRNFIFLIDLAEEDRVEDSDNVIFRGDYFGIFHNYNRIEIEYFCLENDSKVHFHDITLNSFIQLRVHPNSELIIRDQNENEVLRTIIRENTWRNRQRYERDIERIDIVIDAMVLPVAFGFITVLGWFIGYDRRLF